MNPAGEQRATDGNHLKLGFALVHSFTRLGICLDNVGLKNNRLDNGGFSKMT
jgi:hypothetical protein